MSSKDLILIMIISRLPALTPWLVKRAKLLGYQMTQISFLKAAARPPAPDGSAN
jgi:hypothetical protein